ncbi:hypothetical protein WMY93_020535 [Mugilogobius chulae]|uniref:Uncharacterized protein n=1 Tax=Mugilogobius chulae TaxID=88201 RepID=A0AAW0NB90_9GOBI
MASSGSAAEGRPHQPQTHGAGASVVSTRQALVRWQMKCALTEGLTKAELAKIPHRSSSISPTSMTRKREPELGGLQLHVLPIHSSTAKRKFHRFSNSSAMDLHSSTVGTAINSSTRQSQMAVTTSGTIVQTVETPTLKLLAMVLYESPVVRNLDKR